MVIRGAIVDHRMIGRDRINPRFSRSRFDRRNWHNR